MKTCKNTDEDLQEYGEAEAQAGVHYVPFDDATLLSKSYVPAGATIAKVPIVVLRDPSLDTQSVALRITFKDNGIFQPGYPRLSSLQHPYVAHFRSLDQTVSMGFELLGL